MEITDLPLFSMLKQRMTWLNQRQDLLSQNVANADTPKYVSRDLKTLEFDQILKGAGHTGTSMVATNARHFSLTPSRSGKYEDHEAPDQEYSPNGNAVALEVQMIKVSDTQAQYQAAANLYAKAMSMMRTAIGR